MANDLPRGAWSVVLLCGLWGEAVERKREEEREISRGGGDVNVRTYDRNNLWTSRTQHVRTCKI